MRGPFRRALTRQRILRRGVRRRIRRRGRRLALRSAVILLIGGAAAALKLKRQDVDRIEKESGKPAEDLSEAELLAAMKKLGIHKLELTAADETAIDEADAQDGE